MATLLALLMTLLAVAGGLLLTYLVVERLPLLLRLCAATVVGLAALAWLGFLPALAFGLNAVSLTATAVILVLGLILLRRRVSPDLFRDELDALKVNRGSLLYYGFWTALLAWLCSRVVMFEAGELRTAPANNFGDLPFHLGVITSFAYGENLPPQNPIFAGMRFTYPFLIDFLTAFFIRLGADWRAAFFIENIALALALVGLLQLLTHRLTGSRTAAGLAPFIFLFNGGLGFVNFFREASQAQTGFIQFLTHLPHAYTMNDELLLPAGTVPLRWGNVFTTLLLPQRSMLFGLPFAALIITLWWMAWGEGCGPTERRRYLLAAGVLTGALPMLHAHGFFAVMIAAGALALLFFSLEWKWFFGPALLLSAPQAWWLSGTQVRNKLFQPHLWWEAGASSPLLFWLANAGIFIGLLLLALLTRRLSSPLVRRFYLPFALWFILPNVVLLAPWPWDNIKVLVYWALASTPFVALTLAQFSTERAKSLRILGAMICILLLLSGVLDVWRALSPVENLALFGRAEVEVAEMMRRQTTPRARILHAPIHNSVTALTGRQSLLGYPGHLWTHGIEYAERERDVQAIYRGGPVAAELLAKWQIDYVIIGPIERAQLKPDEQFFAEKYRAIIEHEGYRVFQIKTP